MKRANYHPDAPAVGGPLHQEGERSKMSGGSKERKGELVDVTFTRPRCPACGLTRLRADHSESLGDENDTVVRISHCVDCGQRIRLWCE